MDHKAWSAQFCEAEKTGVQIEAPKSVNPEMTIEDAYAIQLATIDQKIAGGETVIGLKIGLTSIGMQKLLGVNEPDYGHLMDSMLLREGEPCDTKTLLQPRVEGELAFCLKSPLKGPGITVSDVYNATAWVSPAIEVVDSRIKDWKIKLEDTISDNGSSARFVLGGKMTPIGDIDMKCVGMTLERNGLLVSSGAGAEVMGNPAYAVAWLANKLAQFGISLKTGDIIMSGALTAMEPASPGDVYTVSFTNMGFVTVRFE